MPMPNPGSTKSPYAGTPESPSEPAYDFFAITPDNANDLAMRPRAIYVGLDGNIVMHNNNGTSVTLTGVKQGSILSISPRRILATGTTATGLVGLV